MGRYIVLVDDRESAEIFVLEDEYYEPEVFESVPDAKKAIKVYRKECYGVPEKCFKIIELGED